MGCKVFNLNTFGSARFSVTLILLLFTQILFSQNQTVTFNYTGGMQTWTVPPCVNSITITAAGAKGGGANGGNGALVNGTINVTPGQVLNIFVGGMGTLGNNSGGYNGGGTGFASTDGNTNYSSWGGGGASDVRIGGTALANRIIIAGGGGGRSGGSSPVCGGAASSASCVDGGQGCSTYGTGALGGTQFTGGAGGTPWAGTPPGGSPGSLGLGGQAGLWQTASGGGGGGGYYGGGGGGNDGCCTGANGGGGGGGGSSLLPPGGTCSGALNANNGFITITYIPGFTVTASNTGPYCPGATIQLNLQAVNLPVGATYSWSGPAGFSSNVSNPTIANATASNDGTYNVLVTAPGCTANATTTVTIYPTPTVTAGADQNVCQNSTVTLNATGASSYSWTSGISNGVAFTPALGANTYTVTGTNASGCTATDDVVVTVSPLPTLNAGNDTSICAGQSITMNAIASPGSNLFWSNGVTNGVPITPGSTTSYFVTATSPQNCVAFDIIQVTVNPVPAVYAGADQTICQGTPITLSGLGATTYQWNNGVSNNVSFTPPVGTNTYSMTGFSSQNCSSTDNVVITVNPSPTPVISGSSTYCQNNPATLATSTVFNNYSWSNGSITPTITATQANNPITVTVTNQFNCSATSAPFNLTQLPSITSSTNVSICQGQSATIHGLAQNAAGTYTATFQTANGCDSTSNVTLTINALPAVNAGIDQTICQGNTVTLSGAGASNYQWNNGVTNGATFTPPLGTTTYTLTGISPDNCSNTDNVTITVNPNPLPVISGSSTYCQNTSSVLSTTSTFNTYNWSNGSNSASISATQVNNPITVTVTNQFNCSATSAPFSVAQIANIITNSNVSICQGQSATIHGVAQNTAGTYSAIFQSANGCDSTSNVTLTMLSLPPVNAGIDQTICQGNTVTLSGSGASNYQWNNGITNGTAFTPPLGSTTYTLTGISPDNCSNTDNVTITVNPNPLPVISGASTYCQNTSSVLSTTSAFNTYNWSNGGNSASISATQVNNPITVTVTNQFNCSATSAPFSVTQIANIITNSNVSVCQGQSATIHGVAQNTAGTYSGNFQSANGCDSTSNVTLTILSLPPVNAGVDQTICEGGNVTLSGTGASTYLWNNGVSNGINFTPPLGTTIYTLTGTDANNCQATDQVTVTVNATPNVNAGSDITICTGESVTLTATGATNVNWDNNVTNGQAFNPTTTTLYTVTGSSNGCTDTDDVLVSVLDAPTASISGDGNYCEGETINPITVNVGTGFNSYSVTYSLNGQVQPPLIVTGNSATITPPGTVGSYEFQLISVSSNGANQCSSQPIDSVLIQVNPNPVIDAGEDLVLCEPSGGNPDEITLQGSGGVSYTWTNGVTNGIPFIPASGTTTFIVTGTDANGCIGTDQVTVNALPLPDANGNANVTFGHVTLNTTVENLSSNATQYVWYFGDGDSLVTNNLSSTTYSYTEPGTYLVELVASNGICQDIWTQEIEVIAPMTVNPPNVFTPNGDGSNDSYFVHVENGATFYGIILNRWGNKVTELTELNQGWDGSVNGNLFADGVYFIEYRATDFNGNEVTGHTYFHLVR